MMLITVYVVVYVSLIISEIESARFETFYIYCLQPLFLLICKPT